MPLGGRTLESMNDYLVWYAKSASGVKYRQIYIPATPKIESCWTTVELSDGTRRKLLSDERRDLNLIPAQSRLYRLVSQTAPSYAESGVFEFEMNGRVFRPPKGQSWVTTIEKMELLRDIGRLEVERNLPGYVLYYDDFPLGKLTSPWSDTAPAQDLSYVVQINSRVIERCMLMTTDLGDLVLDPTCGSGTTAYVAEQWGRRWITIDTSRVALALARQRLMGARYPYYLLADSADGRRREGELTVTPLPPTEITDDIRHGFVYERVQHITLKSIANNPDIKEGMSREEIDAAIRRHAEFELLYDKPYEDTRKVRVAGPFTVESLSPHRSLAFAGSAVDGEGATNVDLVGDVSVGDTSFEQTILANLRTAGIQNGRKGERLTFDTVESYAAAHIQAVGERDGVTDDIPKRVGLTIGPQYGTVGPSFIKDAAREANRAGDLDLLCVLAFAFDPSVLGSGDEYVTSEDGFANVAAERQLGKVPVLLVRMNADLVMGEELKKTGAGNLFTVFGEPDIAIKEEDGEFRVILHGVDVYDPNTGELRSNDTDQVALWMIDTEYNGESFFVRHCYFTGGQDPFARLKRALKAEIDAEAWDSLYRTESRSFPRPESGKIAVKVINDYGDEVMKVFTV